MSILLERIDTDEPNVKAKLSPEVKPFRRILPQVLTCMVLNLFVVGAGSASVFPTILVPAVTAKGNVLTTDETVHLSADEATWIASIFYLGQPVGSIASGVVADMLGRKRGLYVAGFPCIIGWLTLGTANSYYVILLAIALLGLGHGLLEGPLKSLFSEICEPSIRGTLAATIGTTATLGIFLIYLLGNFLAWRQVAIICSVGPVCALIAMLFFPESPMWLLMKHRRNDALNSLSFVRGWVLSQSVCDEFERLKRHSELSRSCSSCEKSGVKCTHPSPTLCDKFKDMTRKRNQKPFILITILNVFMQFTALFMMRPYLMQILDAYGLPFDGSKTTVFLGLLGICSNIFQMLTIRVFGKRNIYLYTMAGLFLCCFALGIYGFAFFPAGFTSFDKDSNIIDLIRKDAGSWKYFAFVVFLFMYFCYTIGISSIPWVLTPELFPFKSRSFYTGILSAQAQFFGFITSKIYYNMEVELSLVGVFNLFGVIEVIGFILMYFILPETEQRSLEDIEMHYSDNSRGLTDINIHINRHCEPLKNSDAK